MAGANPYFIAVVFLSVLLLGTALYGWRSAPRVPMNQRFAAQTLLVTWWAIGVSGLHSGHATEFWGKWTFASAALMPAMFLSFAESFPSGAFYVSRLAKRSIQGLALGFASVASFTPWIAHSFVVNNSVLTRTQGFMMPAFCVFFLASTVVIFVILAMKLRAASGVGRAQLRLYFIGLLLFCMGAIPTNLILPSVFNDSRYSILGPWFVLVFLSFVAHGIIRYRFMNLKLIVHNWLTVGIASVIAMSPLALTLGIGHSYLALAHSPGVNHLAILLAGLLSTPLWLVTRSVLHRYVYRGDADFRSLVSSASEKLSQTLAPLEIAGVIAETVSLAVLPERLALYLRSHRKKPTCAATLVRSRWQDLPLDSLPPAITSAVSDGQVLASPTYVAVETQAEVTSDVMQTLTENNWALVLPLSVESELVGAVAIGEKLSGAPYYREDLGLLRVLAHQAAIGLKNAELYQRVLLANQQVENIVGTIQSGILVYYSDDDIRILNDAASRLLSLNGQSGQSILCIQDLPPGLTMVLQQSLSTKERAFELTLQRGNESIPIMCAMSLLRGSSGETAGAVVVLTDVSLVNALEVERNRAERLNYYESLAAALAHEIANPLVPIKTMAHLLLERSIDTAFVMQSAKTIAREVDRIERLVDRLRSLSRPANHYRCPVNVASSIEEAIAVMRSMFQERNIDVQFECTSAEAIVLGDADDLHELFLNLLINAVEASDQNGVIEVTVTSDMTTVRIAIADRGPGIATEIASRLFEPLVSSKERGSGLGLAVCQGIVARHQGRIEASNRPAGGAIFVVEMPSAADQHNTKLTSRTIL